MNLLITGGTGFIGRVLCKNLHRDNHQLTVLSRNPDSVKSLCGQATRAITSLNELKPSDHFNGIINLSGEGIADHRWTEKRKKILYASRIQITEEIVAFIERAEQRPEVLISGSAIGYYGDSGATIINENSGTRPGFSHELCAAWEKSALQAVSGNVRVCIIRTGLVIGQNGGFLNRMLPAFRFGLGGRLGNGKQWMSWIHRVDLIRIIRLLLDNHDLQGAFNATAPNPVSNTEFTRTLATALNRPALAPVPASILKLLLGEMSELLLGGQRVYPKHLTDNGFTFEFNNLEQALQDVIYGNN